LIPLATFVFEISYLFTVAPALLIAMVLYVFPKRQQAHIGPDIHPV
jgi:hypothetical protein